MLFEGSDMKQCVDSAWKHLARSFTGIQLDEFILMPNHIHGILWIERSGAFRVAASEDSGNEVSGRLVGVPNLVGAFKTLAARGINAVRGARGVPVWQRNYYEHVIRDGSELNRIREYIIANPDQWLSDEENPANRLHTVTPATSHPNNPRNLRTIVGAGSRLPLPRTPIRMSPTERS